MDKFIGIVKEVVSFLNSLGSFTLGVRLGSWSGNVTIPLWVAVVLALVIYKLADEGWDHLRRRWRTRRRR